MSQKLVRCEWLLIPLALAYGAIMLSLGQGTLTQLWSADPYHRYQAVALLEGHYSLANSLDAMQAGLAWHNGRVQQVCGLGVGFWLMPFQAVWRLFGGQVFPDRVALGAAFALLAYYASSTGLRLAKDGRRLMGLGLIWLIVLCPPLWTLARVFQSVFEQTVLYAVVLSLGILVSVVQIVWFGSRRDYWLCCVLSAMAAWMRPTCGIYGFAAVLVCSLFMAFRHRAPKLAVSGSSIFLLSLVLLGLTNWIRFGRSLEFGHRLTIASSSMVYLSRFGNPYQQATPWEATKELAGLLLLSPNVHNAYAYSEDLFPSQAPETRFRRLYLTAFDPSYALGGMAALGAVLTWISRHWRRRWRGLGQQPDTLLGLALFSWSGVALGGLGLFYLYFPIVESRYLLDFAPAFIGLVACIWVMNPRGWARYAWPLLGGWLLYEIVTAEVAVQTPELAEGRTTESALPRVKSVSLKQFDGVYSAAHSPSGTGIPWNGRGWAQNGFADDVVTLAVDKPQYVELRVDNRQGLNGQPARQDVYRAMIDGVLLPLDKVVRDDYGWRVKFDVPPELQDRTNDGILFLCFSKGYDAEDRDSDRLLYSVRWR